MPERLYLIRINLERYLGPMSIHEVRTSYKKMEFGLQDEIAGSNNNWVAFDDLDSMRKVYPELLNLIKNHILSGWGVSSQIKSMQKPSTAQHSPTNAPAMSKFFFVGIGLAMFIVGIFLNLDWFASQQESFSNYQEIRKIQNILSAKKYDSFVKYMDRNERSLQQKMKTKSLQADWLPYIRSWAFLKTGDIPWIKKNILRGRASAVPRDCSLAAWNLRWEKSTANWRDFINGVALPQSDWARILYWDPNWVRRRPLDPGWKYPKNYQHACLLMALRALRDGRPLKGNLQVIKDTFLARLSWQLEILGETPTAHQISMSGTAWTLSCIESAETSEALSTCNSSKTSSRDWQKALNYRTKRRLSEILVKNNLKPQRVKKLKILADQTADKDPYSKFDYSTDNQYLRAVIKEGNNSNRSLRPIRR